MSLDSVAPGKDQFRLVVDNNPAWSVPTAGIVYEIIGREIVPYRKFIVRIVELPLAAQVADWWRLDGEYGWPDDYFTVVNSVVVS